MARNVDDRLRYLLERTVHLTGQKVKKNISGRKYDREVKSEKEGTKAEILTDLLEMEEAYELPDTIEHAVPVDKLREYFQGGKE